MYRGDGVGVTVNVTVLNLGPAKELMRHNAPSIISMLVHMEPHSSTRCPEMVMALWSVCIEFNPSSVTRSKPVRKGSLVDFISGEWMLSGTANDAIASWVRHARGRLYK